MFGFLSLLRVLPLPVFGLLLIFVIAMCVHVVKTGRSLYWIWIMLLIVPPLGAIVYFFAIVLPELMRGPTARRMGKAARDTLDPGRDYRHAQALWNEAPTVQNGMKLAEAAATLGRWAEAEQLYVQAMQGFYADDPALLIGRARALVELNRAPEALDTLAKLAALGEKETPQATLVRARALQAVGRLGEADQAFRAATERLPGLEALARYAAFQAETGRKAEARQTLAEIDRRVDKARAQFRREAQAWRDFAAQRVAA
jgi:hypothetical protein